MVAHLGTPIRIVRSGPPKTNNLARREPIMHLSGAKT
jgi:hypothetical protein